MTCVAHIEHDTLPEFRICCAMDTGDQDITSHIGSADLSSNGSGQPCAQVCPHRVLSYLSQLPGESGAFYGYCEGGSVGRMYLRENGLRIQRIIDRGDGSRNACIVE